jgi:hypothetical protein
MTDRITLRLSPALRAAIARQGTQAAVLRAGALLAIAAGGDLARVQRDLFAVLADDSLSSDLRTTLLQHAQTLFGQDVSQYVTSMSDIQADTQADTQADSKTGPDDTDELLGEVGFDV